MTRHRAVGGPLLLTQDLRFTGRDLRLGAHGSAGEPADESVAEQLVLPGVEPPPARIPRRRSRPVPNRPAMPPPEDALLTTFVRRLASFGRARKGQLAYAYQMRSMLAIATRVSGQPVTCADLIQDEKLLGRVLVHDIAPTLQTQVSRWTLAQRRSALRSFAALMRPELLALLGEEPLDRVERALRSVAERIGAGYRLNGGAPRRRGGRAPTAGQIADVLEAVGREPGYRGDRNLAFFTILAETGVRVNALRMLDGADCIEMPNGRLRVFLHQKGTGEPREVELSHDAAAKLRAYVGAFNYHAAVRRWPVRVRLGETGAVWRNSPRGRWSDADIRATLGAGCSAAEVLAFTSHAFRRAFATDAASVMPRHTVAQAGGWKGLERLDDHYVQPRAATIREKLADRDGPCPRSGTAEGTGHAAARPL
jgi:integrase